MDNKSSVSPDGKMETVNSTKKLICDSAKIPLALTVGNPSVVLENSTLSNTGTSDTKSAEKTVAQPRPATIALKPSNITNDSMKVPEVSIPLESVVSAISTVPKTVSTDNKPAEVIETKSLPKISTDVTISTSATSTAVTATVTENPRNNELNLKVFFGVMRNESERLLTFTQGNWPIKFVTGESLANAGFFYLKNSDRVQCAFCRVVICSWEEGDIALVEHKKHFRRCPFIMGYEVGNNPIDLDPIRRVRPRRRIKNICGCYHRKSSSLIKSGRSCKLYSVPPRSVNLDLKTPKLTSDSMKISVATTVTTPKESTVLKKNFSASKIDASNVKPVETPKKDVSTSSAEVAVSTSTTSTVSTTSTTSTVSTPTTTVTTVRSDLTENPRNNDLNLNVFFGVMRNESERLLTFTEDRWPISFISAESLASAGFFYLKNSDRVQCAFCKVVICFWEEGDNALEEHKKHFPRCPFIMGYEVGNNPIDRDPIRGVRPRGRTADICGSYHRKSLTVTTSGHTSVVFSIPPLSVNSVLKAN